MNAQAGTIEEYVCMNVYACVLCFTGELVHFVPLCKLRGQSQEQMLGIQFIYPVRCLLLLWIKSCRLWFCVPQRDTEPSVHAMWTTSA